MTVKETKSSLFSNLGIYLDLAGARSRGWIFVAIVGSVVLAFLDMIGVAAMLPLMTLISGNDTTSGTLGQVSSYIGTNDIAVLTPVLAGFVALVFILKSVGTIPFRWWLVGRTTRLSADAASELFRRYMLSPYSVHRTRNMPEIYRNISDSTVQASSVLLAVMVVMSDLLVLMSILVVLLVTSPLVTLFTIVFFGAFLGLIQRALRRQQRRVGEELAEASIRGWQFLMPALDGFREVRLSSSADAFVKGYRDARYQGASAQRNLTIISELPKYFLEIAFVVAVGIIAWLLFGTGDRESAITVLGVFAAASLRALPTLNRISATIAMIRSGQVGLGILVDAAEQLGAHPSHDEESRGEAPFQGDIVLDAVTYRYPDADTDVLQGLSMRIKADSTAAIVGSSGAGKSTALDIILGLLRPSSGRITAGGRDISEDLVTWYEGLGVVPQDVFLVNDTLTANVAFGVPSDAVDHERVAEALEHAELTQFVSTLPEGASSIVGERGTRLSGGQRQRIGLARALYRNPRVLVLDEATSALDNETEHQIAETLRKLSGTMTVIIVAHRLSTVRDADRLFFLSDGTVEAEGTFEEVREAAPAFAQLVALGELT